MSASKTLWPVVRLVATRLAVRSHPPSRGIRLLLIGSSLVLAASAAVVFMGVSSLVAVGVLAVSSMLMLAGLSLWWFPASMAVSVVGVALACASLMTAQSVTTGFEHELTRAMSRLNGHVLLTKYGLDFFEYDEVADRWLTDARVQGASPFAFSMMAVVGPVDPPADPALAPPRLEGASLAPDDPWGPAAEADAQLVEEPEGNDDDPPGVGPAVVVGKGIDPDRAADLDGFAEVLGRRDLSALRPGDGRHLPGIVLGAALARHLSVEVGEHVRVVVPAEIDGRLTEDIKAPRHATFEVLDLVHTGTSEFDRNLALMHLTAAQSMFFRAGRVTGIEFFLHDPELAEPVAADMQAGQGDVFRVSTWKETNVPLLQGLQQIRMTLWVVLGLMVLVASSSLVASLLLIVRRKHHDIAVLLALGASPRAVFWMFEVIGLLAGVVGSALGVALGGLYCAVVRAYAFPLGSDIYPVDALPVIVGPIEALGPAVAAVALCGLTSGPVALIAARVVVVKGLRR